MSDAENGKKDHRPLVYLQVTRVKYILQFFLCLLGAQRVEWVGTNPLDSGARIAAILRFCAQITFAVLAVEFAWRLIYPRRKYHDVV